MFALILGALLFGGSFSLLGHLGIRLPWLETSAAVRYVMDIDVTPLFRSHLELE